MTTENGLPRSSEMRRHINVLRDRSNWLADKLAAKILERPEVNPGSFWEAQEIRALQWAIPVLEAEFDNAARMRGNISIIEGRIGALEANGVELDARHPHRWTLASGEVVDA